VCGDYNNGSGWGYDESGKYGWQNHSICKILNCDNDTRLKQDLLEVLEKWRTQKGRYPLNKDAEEWHLLWEDESEIIGQFRTNPDSVIAKGKEEGWL
jgi:hypothetical protein